MFSEADFCGEAKQNHFCGFSSGYVKYLSTVLGTVCVDEHILSK